MFKIHFRLTTFNDYDAVAKILSEHQVVATRRNKEKMQISADVSATVVQNILDLTLEGPIEMSDAPQS